MDWFLYMTGTSIMKQLTPLYHLYCLHRNLDISPVITADSSPLHVASSRTQTGTFEFPSVSREPTCKQGKQLERRKMTSF